MTDRLIAAIVPTFRPDTEVAERLRALAAQVDVVVVTDDGSGRAFEAVLAGLEREGHVVLPSTVNRGIASALNRGAAHAQDLGATFVLTVDQDTVVGSGYVRGALDALKAVGDPAGVRVAVVAGAVDGAAPAGTSVRWPGERWELLQSGLFVSSELLQRVGPFEEGFFIDCVDTEWGLRAQALGVRFAAAEACVLAHGAGVEVVRRLPAVGEVRFSVHSPVRRFYITRNRVVLSTRYAARRPRWFVWQTRTQLSIAALGLLSGPQRAAQLAAAVLGAAHGLLGRGGPIPPRILSALQGGGVRRSRVKRTRRGRVAP